MRENRLCCITYLVTVIYIILYNNINQTTKEKGGGETTPILTIIIVTLIKKKSVNISFIQSCIIHLLYSMSVISLTWMLLESFLICFISFDRLLVFNNFLLINKAIRFYCSVTFKRENEHEKESRLGNLILLEQIVM